jgi:hypothetical protein
MKTILLGALALLIGFSCSAVLDGPGATKLDAQSRNLSGAEVELLTVNDIVRSYHGMVSRERNIVVRVKDLGYEKNLAVFGELESGVWDNLSSTARFMGPAGDGYELWNIYASRGSYRGDPKWGDEFVIRYDVAGATYWDNNSGNNHVADYHSGAQMTPAAGNIRLNFDNHYQYKNSVGGNLFVRNLAPQKTIKIVYTMDNWTNSSIAYASYKSEVYPSYGSSIPSPNRYGVESWTFSFALPEGIGPQDVEYAIAYEVNGVTYWDNNFGNNYVPGN